MNERNKSCHLPAINAQKRINVTKQKVLRDGMVIKNVRFSLHCTIMHTWNSFLAIFIKHHLSDASTHPNNDTLLIICHYKFCHKHKWLVFLCICRWWMTGIRVTDVNSTAGTFIIFNRKSSPFKMRKPLKCSSAAQRCKYHTVYCGCLSYFGM
jgi:hypothetical protein